MTHRRRHSSSENTSFDKTIRLSLMLYRCGLQLLRKGADLELLENSLQAISHRAATRIQMFWRAKVAAIVFLDRCSVARFSVQAFTCDRVFQSVIKRFSYPHSASTSISHVVVFTCVSSIVRSIVRTLEVARIVPFSRKPFNSISEIDHECDDRGAAAIQVQKVYRGHVCRWFFDALRQDTIVAKTSQTDSDYECTRQPAQEICNVNESPHISNFGDLCSSPVVSGAMAYACTCIQKCWRGSAERRRIRSSLGFSIGKCRLAFQNLKIAICEREEHDKYVERLEPVTRDQNSLQNNTAALQRSTAAEANCIGDIESIGSAHVCFGQSTSVEGMTSERLPVLNSNFFSDDLKTEHLFVEDEAKNNMEAACRVQTITEASSISLPQPESLDPAVDLEALGQPHLADDTPPQVSILLIQRLARRWLGRRAIKARRLILWRVRLIVQAAPAALRIQSVFRGHLGRAVYKKLWKWTHDPEPDQADYSGLPATFAECESATVQQSLVLKLSELKHVEELKCSVDRNQHSGETLLDTTIVSILQSLYKDPETKKYVVRLMLDAPLPIPSAASALPVHKLWKHGNDSLNIPWIRVNVVPPHMQPNVPDEMKVSIQSFSSDPRIPGDDDPLLVSDPLSTLSKQLSCSFENILEGFSNGNFPLFVKMVEGRCKIVRSSMGIECVQSLTMDLLVLRVLLSCAHASLESFRYLRNQESPLSDWKSMEGLFRNPSNSWRWLFSNSLILKWCLCQDETSMKQCAMGRQLRFGVVADAMLKRCKECLDMSVFFLRNSCNQFPPSCSWVRAWYFSLRGLWNLTNGKKLFAIQQMQESFIELTSSHMRHAVYILQYATETQNMSNRENFVIGGLSPNGIGLGMEDHKRRPIFLRPKSAISSITSSSETTSVHLIEKKSGNRPISAASSFT